MESLKQRPEVASFIKKVCQGRGITDYVITEVKTNQKGEGFLGEIFMVTIKNTTTNKKFPLVIKAAFVDEKIRDMVPIRNSFQNEIVFYSSIYPTLLRFQKDRGVSIQKLVPECLKTTVETQNEMLALENLRDDGFQCLDKTAELDDDHVGLIFKTYGRFHALSFVLRDQEPAKFEKLASGIYNVYAKFMEKSHFGHHLMEVSKVVQRAFVPGEDDEIIKKYEKYADENIVNLFADVVNADCKYSAILHGDCWSNNMMFKYENSSGDRPTEMRLIDWQLMKVGSPVCDLSYCLYSGASKKIFDRLDHYLRIYHDSFSSVVKEMGSDAEKLYPFSALKEDWRKYAKFGMIMSFAILKMKLTNKDDIIDLTDGFEMDDMIGEFMNSRFNEEDYFTRIRGLITHMNELGAL